MSVQDGTTIYKLKKSLSYSLKGETRQAQFIELREPKMSHANGYVAIKQMVAGLMVATAKSRESGGLEAITQSAPLHETLEEREKAGDDEGAMAELLPLLFGMDQSVKMSHFLETFRKIACHSRQSSICVVDGEVEMTEGIWESLAPEDALNAACWWAGFFTMPSGMTDKGD